jgi:hypothetical protein
VSTNCDDRRRTKLSELATMGVTAAQNAENVAKALKEARMKGLPDCWTVQIDVSSGKATRYSIGNMYICNAAHVDTHSLVFRQDDDESGSLRMDDAVTRFPRQWPCQ